jgi:hypothetical protein
MGRHPPTDDDDLTPYCIEGCGRPALETFARFVGFVGDAEVVELTCWRHTAWRHHAAVVLSWLTGTVRR